MCKGQLNSWINSTQVKLVLNYQSSGSELLSPSQLQSYQVGSNEDLRCLDDHSSLEYTVLQVYRNLGVILGFVAAYSTRASSGREKKGEGETRHVGDGIDA